MLILKPGRSSRSRRQPRQKNTHDNYINAKVQRLIYIRNVGLYHAYPVEVSELKRQLYVAKLVVL